MSDDQYRNGDVWDDAFSTLPPIDTYPLVVLSPKAEEQIRAIVRAELAVAPPAPSAPDPLRDLADADRGLGLDYASEVAAYRRGTLAGEPAFDPPAPSAPEMTDAMVEAACAAFDGPEPVERWTHEEREFRSNMRAALAAAMGVRRV